MCVCSDTLSMPFSSNVVFILTFSVLDVAHEARSVLCGWDWRFNLIAVLFLLFQTLPTVLIIPSCVLIDIFCVMIVFLQVLED